MSVEDLQAVGLGGSHTRSDAGELLAEIAVAACAVVLGHVHNRLGLFCTTFGVTSK